MKRGQGKVYDISTSGWHTANFKNKKRVFYNKTSKKPFVATPKEIKERMQTTIDTLRYDKGVIIPNTDEHISHFLQYIKDNLADRKTILCKFRISDNRVRDLDGMLSTIMDCLTKSGKIEDDSTKYIGSIHVTFENVEKGDEGVAISVL